MWPRSFSVHVAQFRCVRCPLKHPRAHAQSSCSTARAGGGWGTTVSQHPQLGAQRQRGPWLLAAGGASAAGGSWLCLRSVPGSRCEPSVPGPSLTRATQRSFPRPASRPRGSQGSMREHAPPGTAETGPPRAQRGRPYLFKEAVHNLSDNLQCLRLGRSGVGTAG